jgi:hypothetical protein
MATASIESIELRAWYMLGRCANGAERDKGVLIHAVPVPGWKALCGKQPGRRSAGWASHPDQEHPLNDVNCPRCAKKMEAA